MGETEHDFREDCFQTRKIHKAKEDVMSKQQETKSENILISSSIDRESIESVNILLEARIESLMEEINHNEHKCKACGKINKGKDSKRDLGRHIETHIEGLSYPCDLCAKVSGTSTGHRRHVNKMH